jgi:RHS repeat-associated protein
VRTAEYRPFGEGENPAAGVSAVRFTGEERDRESGLDYFGARYYASRTGRFTTVDPGHVGGNIFDPQSWNAYAYARNNPLRFIDPHGLDWFEVNGQWEYLDGVSEMNSYTYNKSGALVDSRVIKGVTFGLVFTGTSLVELRADGTTRSFMAVSGRVADWGEVHPEQQADRNVGPIPAGKYEFDPSSIQSISTRDRLLGWIRRGAWPGSTYAWGD